MTVSRANVSAVKLTVGELVSAVFAILGHKQNLHQPTQRLPRTPLLSWNWQADPAASRGPQLAACLQVVSTEWSSTYGTICQAYRHIETTNDGPLSTLHP